MRDMEARRAWQRAHYAANRENKKARARALYAENKLERAAKSRARWAKTDPELKRKKLRQNAAYRASNPGKVLEWKRRFVERHGPRIKVASRIAQQRRAGALPPTRPMPTNCECCGKEVTDKVLNLDHCHETGAFRGWLCWPCNVGIGHLGDTSASLIRALEYLKRADA